MSGSEVDRDRARRSMTVAVSFPRPPARETKGADLPANVIMQISAGYGGRSAADACPGEFTCDVTPPLDIDLGLDFNAAEYV